MANRLSRLENVKDWLGISTNNDDILLSRLIDQSSRFILSFISRPSLFQTVYSETYDGMGQATQMLRNYPVISVASVMVGNTAIPALSEPPTSNCGYGWVLQASDGLPPGRPQEVVLRCARFCRGNSNVSIIYTAGFVAQAEPQVVPSSGDYSVAVNETYGFWAVDQGVSYVAGAALTPLPYSPGTTLSAGQYMSASGIYYFSSSDAGAALLINYSYVPFDIDQACMELVGERYNAKARIGQVSKSLGGQETVSYSQKDMSDFVKSLLLPYRRVVPV